MKNVKNPKSVIFLIVQTLYFGYPEAENFDIDKKFQGAQQTPFFPSDGSF